MTKDATPWTTHPALGPCAIKQSDERKNMSFMKLVPKH